MIKHIHKTIHRLKQEPEDVRQHIVHIVTFACAVILITLYFYSLGKKLTDKEVQTSIQKDAKPFTVLKDNLVDGYKSISTSGN